MYYGVPCRTRLRRETLQTIYVLQLILRVAAVHGVCRRVVMFADTTRAQEASRVRLDPSKIEVVHSLHSLPSRRAENAGKRIVKTQDNKPPDVEKQLLVENHLFSDMISLEDTLASACVCWDTQICCWSAKIP